MSELQAIYSNRFGGTEEYRREIWKILVADYFSQWTKGARRILDLGCGYGEFINAVRCERRYAMDLNPDSARHLDPDVVFLKQDCSEEWPLENGGLDLVFTSNFFEHLPDKATLGKTLDQARRCLAPDGRLIAMGPNIRLLPGQYWDFWDHHLELSDLSLAEGLGVHGFTVERRIARFLPFTMVGAPRYPTSFLRAYLCCPPAWRFFGKQFLIVARIESAEDRKSQGAE